MKPSSSLQRYVLAVGIGGAGMVVTWLSREPSCLLAAVAASCIYGGRAPAVLVIGVCGLSFVAFLLVPGSYFPFELNTYLRTAVFLAAAVVTGLLIRDYRRTEAARRTEHETRLIVESMPGH